MPGTRSHPRALSPPPPLDLGLLPCTSWVTVKAEMVMKIQSPFPTGTLPSLPEQDTIFQVNLLREIHLAGDSGENQSLLAAVREWKFDFTVKASWPQQGRIQSVCSVCGHDHLALGTGQLRPLSPLHPLSCHDTCPRTCQPPPFPDSHTTPPLAQPESRTLTLTFWSNPSIWFSSSSRIL